MREKFSGEQESEASKIPLNIDTDLVVERIIANGRGWKPEKIEELKKHTEDLMHRYKEMKLDLPIEDEPMRRICQVLTDNEFVTEESCDGHGKELPRIFFTCKDQKMLSLLTDTLLRRSNIKKFPWDIKLWCADSSSPLKFILSPSQDKGMIDPEKEREELLKDLDIIGIQVKEDFE